MLSPLTNLYAVGILCIDYIPYHIHITNSTQEYAYIQDLQPEKSKWGPPLPDEIVQFVNESGTV